MNMTDKRRSALGVMNGRGATRAATEGGKKHLKEIEKRKYNESKKRKLWKFAPSVERDGGGTKTEEARREEGIIKEDEKKNTSYKRVNRKKRKKKIKVLTGGQPGVNTKGKNTAQGSVLTKTNRG